MATSTSSGQAGIRFDGQVVIVTGAGGNPSLGRSYAQLLARLGARVVVNDLGVGPDGMGTISAHAERVVDEIRAEGGEAIADAHSVSTEEGAQAIVRTALDEWGRVDALINNAGVARFVAFDELSSADIRTMVDVHLMGTIWMCRAVWPHMGKAGYGRIVNTVSGAMFGAGYGSIYGAAKAGIYGLTRTLAIEGERNGIRVNALQPGATTVSWHVQGFGDPPPEMAAKRTPEGVAPSAAFLAHEACSFSGKTITSEEGRLFETYYSQTTGYENPQMTIDDVSADWDRVVDRLGSHELGDPTESGFWLGIPPGLPPGAPPGAPPGPPPA